MKAEYIQKGNTLNYVNPTEEIIDSGTIVKFGVLCGVVATTIPGKGLGAIATDGVWSVPKDDTDIKEGSIVYYDDSADKATATEKDTALGVAVAAAGTSIGTVSIKLNAAVKAPASEAV